MGGDPNQKPSKNQTTRSTSWATAALHILRSSNLDSIVSQKVKIPSRRVKMYIKQYSLTNIVFSPVLKLKHLLLLYFNYFTGDVSFFTERSILSVCASEASSSHITWILHQDWLKSTSRWALSDSRPVSNTAHTSFHTVPFNCRNKKKTHIFDQRGDFKDFFPHLHKKLHWCEDSFEKWQG